jgi:hypothetical protein
MSFNIYADTALIPPGEKSFPSLTKKEQDKKIIADFKNLNGLMKELFSTFDRIEDLKITFKKAKNRLGREADVCLALSLIEADLNYIKSELSKTTNNKGYKKLQQKYLAYSQAYKSESENISCE